MRNYWIQINEKKRKKIWTVEFRKSGSFSLKARRIEVFNIKFNSAFGQGLQTHGFVSVTFKNAMFSVNDQELISFLSDAHNYDLVGQISRIRVYQGLNNEVENYEITGLKYDSITTGSTGDDIKFTFGFKNIKHFYVS